MDPSVLQKKRSSFPAFLAGGVVILLLCGGVYLLTRSRATGPAAEAPLPMTAVEQAYSANIHFRFPDVPMSRASNMLNQQLTYLNGTVSNDGPRAIRQMEVTIEFRDEFKQVILRDTRRIPASTESAIAAGEHRDFQFVFEHIPVDWERTRQTPTLRVTGLRLE